MQTTSGKQDMIERFGDVIKGKIEMFRDVVERNNLEDQGLVFS